MYRVMSSFVVAFAVAACASQPEPETRLEREIRVTERALDSLNVELDTLRARRQVLDERITDLAARRRTRDTTVVAVQQPPAADTMPVAVAVTTPEQPADTVTQPAETTPVRTRMPVRKDATRP